MRCSCGDCEYKIIDRKLRSIFCCLRPKCPNRKVFIQRENVHYYLLGSIGGASAYSPQNMFKCRADGSRRCLISYPSKCSHDQEVIDWRSCVHQDSRKRLRGSNRPKIPLLVKELSPAVSGSSTPHSDLHACFWISGTWNFTASLPWKADRSEVKSSQILALCLPAC